MTHSINVRMEPVYAGADYKVLQVTGDTPDALPPHSCTGDAFLFVCKGKVVLNLQPRDIELKEGNVFTIPAGLVHSLEALSGFVLYVVMKADARIEFSPAGVSPAVGVPEAMG